MIKTFVIFATLFIVSAANAAPILVYRDEGACEENCAEAIGTLAEKYLAPVRYVKAEEVTSNLLSKSKIWIQPGGNAIDVAKLLSPKQKNALRSFIADGGAYLGICAGAFFADHKVDNANKISGLGLIPGISEDYMPDVDEDFIVKTFWGKKARYLYFQEGATFKLSEKSAQVHILASYEDGRPAAIQFPYGKGMVVLSGPHPEAPIEWKAKLVDPDGDDFDLARELLARASARLR